MNLVAETPLSEAFTAPSGDLAAQMLAAIADGRGTLTHAGLAVRVGVRRAEVEKVLKPLVETYGYVEVRPSGTLALTERIANLREQAFQEALVRAD